MRKRTRVRRPYVALGATALVLLVYALVTVPPRVLVQAPYMLGSAVVGVAVGVPENPYNTLAQQLKTKEDELALREARLSGSEEPLKSGGFFDGRLGIISFCVSIALLVLLLLNFYLDWRREKRTQPAS